MSKSVLWDGSVHSVCGGVNVSMGGNVMPAMDAVLAPSPGWDTPVRMMDTLIHFQIYLVDL